MLKEQSTDKSSVDSQSNKKLRIGSWNVCGFAAEERKRLEIVEQVRSRDLDTVRIQEFLGERGGGDMMQSWRVRMDREKEKGAG